MKYSLIEYSSGLNIDTLLKDSSFSYEKISYDIMLLNDQLRREFHSTTDKLIIHNNKIRALGIAGILKLNQNIEIEIIPKFLTKEFSEKKNWKDTLFLLSTLSKYGRLINSNIVDSGVSSRSNLYELAAFLMAQEFLKNKRNIIRKYQKRSFYSYDIDGDIDFESIFEKNTDGIKQTQISFDKNNYINNVISNAMLIMQKKIVDKNTKAILNEAINTFGISPISNLPKVRFSNRNRKWEKLFSLSYDILRGLGLTYNGISTIGEGFVVNTWQLWQWLLTEGFSIGFSANYITLSEKQYKLGERFSTKGIKDDINVYPDINIISRKDTQLSILIDAKYKILNTRFQDDISRSDLYEALAFCMAAQKDQLCLLYPIFEDSSINENIYMYKKYKLNDIQI